MSQQKQERGTLKASKHECKVLKHLRENSFACFMRREMHSTCLMDIIYTHAVRFGEEQNVITFACLQENSTGHIFK